MRIIDISQMLEDPMAYYPSLRKFELKWARHYRFGDSMSLSEIHMASHVGTHVDSPYHFIQDGKKINEIDLSVFYGTARVIEVPINKQKIDVEFLKGYDRLPERVLFKTKNSGFYKEKKFMEDYIYIDGEAAGYLAEHSVRLVGIDYVSVDKYKASGKEAHRILLLKDIVLLEGIDLNEVCEGEYKLVCFPLKVKNGEGAPCRAVLIED